MYILLTTFGHFGEMIDRKKTKATGFINYFIFYCLHNISQQVNLDYLTQV